MRALAAFCCALQSLALLLFCAFYLWELAQGGSEDATRVVMSAVLIAVFALALGLLARAWVTGATWPNTPTVVWNALLLPVAWSLFQSGRTLIAAAVALVAATGIVASIGARTGAAAGEQDPAGGGPSGPQ